MSDDLINRVIEDLKQYKPLEIHDIKNICNKAKEIFLTESNVIHVQSPIVICGDIHGQFHDLLELFQLGGYPPETNYLFIGDYVDRGNDSVETFIFLLCLKIHYPTRMFLTRGNHECRGISQTYGLYEEVQKKYHGIEV